MYSKWTSGADPLFLVDEKGVEPSAPRDQTESNAHEKVDLRRHKYLLNLYPNQVISRLF